MPIWRDGWLGRVLATQTGGPEFSPVLLGWPGGRVCAPARRLWDQVDPGACWQPVHELCEVQSVSRNHGRSNQGRHWWPPKARGTHKHFLKNCSVARSHLCAAVPSPGLQNRPAPGPTLRASCLPGVGVCSVWRGDTGPYPPGPPMMEQGSEGLSPFCS